MVGMGKISGGEGSLEKAVKEKKKYRYLVDEAGNWIERKDVRRSDREDGGAERNAEKGAEHGEGRSHATGTHPPRC